MCVSLTDFCLKFSVFGEILDFFELEIRAFSYETLAKKSDVLKPFCSFSFSYLQKQSSRISVMNSPQKVHKIDYYEDT